ncbi:uncharacterized protein LTR77_007475 [Saxophila tyrrhenica]|uniref:Heterokaryon incompatibility domain-containing protein n=1 Tax=Saxophila tyrrhenica TaxID=1690608 RepID=A0AAV9P4V6_9PEZI|nr:hypothetical protein LTR77_007475 [Saxophila tyrrhenica]
MDQEEIDPPKLDIPIYQRLNREKREIRLITIQPPTADTDGGALTCGLNVVSLEQKPEYEALSYTWGSRADPEIITLAGKPMTVTKNLFAALSTLRRERAPRALWADAICINQEDPDERTDQVNMMGDIYRGAFRVNVWLGDNSNGMASLILLHGNDRDAHFSEDACDKLFNDLFRNRNSWWSRAWTTQEAVFAKELVFYLGDQQLSFEEHVRFVTALERHLIVTKSCCDSFEKGVDRTEYYAGYRYAVYDLAQRRHKLHKNDFDLLDLIDAYRFRRTSDARDKVFAFTSMACDVPDGLVNYRLPLRDCLIHCAKKLLLRPSGLETLRCVYAGAATDWAKYLGRSAQQSGSRMPMMRRQDLPSWCPDWSQEMIGIYWQLHNQMTYKTLSANFAAAPVATTGLSFSEERMTISGLICDEIQELDERQDPHFGPFPKNDLIQWRLNISTFVDSFLDCHGCGRVVWGPYYKCRQCVDVHYCCRCHKRVNQAHPEHSFLALNEARGDRGSGPAQRRALGPGEYTDFEGNMREVRRAVESDAVERPEGQDAFVLEKPWWSRLRAMTYRSGSNETVHDAFQKTLTASTHLLDHIRKSRYISCPDFAKMGIEHSVLNKALFAHFWHVEVEESPQIELLKLRGRDRDELRAIGSLVQTVVDRKNFFISTQGYIGLGPMDIRAGDMVCVLKGGKVPFILRKTEGPQEGLAEENGTVHCTLVGEAYAPGLMYGEAIRMEQEGVLNGTRFVIH